MDFPSRGGSALSGITGLLPGWIWWSLGAIAALSIGPAVLPLILGRLVALAAAASDEITGSAVVLGAGAILIGFIIMHFPKHSHHGHHLISRGGLMGLFGPSVKAILVFASAAVAIWLPRLLDYMRGLGA